jgi:ectoine hydroxylase-related dioxygenase (phytanoyl-CoA dioxygenase family)
MNNHTLPTPLSEIQIEEYFREGYIVVPGLVPSEEVDKVVAAFPSINADNKGWQPSIFEHENPQKDAERHRLLVEPHVIGAVEQIFEAPARVYYGMTAAVPARGGTGLPWHQDNQYSQMLGGALNVFIALCDITPEMAILWVAPRSHLLGVQRSKSSELYNGGHREAEVEPGNGFPLKGLKKGDACIFDRSTYHRSLKNESDQHRLAYAAQFIADNTREATTGKKDSTRMRARDLSQHLAPLL